MQRTTESAGNGNAPACASTAFQVRVYVAPEGLWIEPVQAATIDIATRQQIVAYPDLRAAAGHVADSIVTADEDLVALPLDEGGGS